MVSMLTTVFTVDAEGNTTLNAGVTVRDALSYLYPSDPSASGIMRYASIVAVTYPQCGLSASTQLLILKAINAAVYVSYINGAIRSPYPYIYKGSDNRRIDRNSTDQQILSAIEFEVKKVK